MRKAAEAGGERDSARRMWIESIPTNCRSAAQSPKHSVEAHTS